MRIFRGCITSLAEQGRIGLQVPNICMSADLISYDADHADNSEIEEYPDDWFVVLHKGTRPAIGREEGYLYLTRKGWEANTEKLKAAFGTKQIRGWTWDDFVKKAEKDLVKRDKALKKLKVKYTKALKQIDELLK